MGLFDRLIKNSARSLIKLELKNAAQNELKDLSRLHISDVTRKGWLPTQWKSTQQEAIRQARALRSQMSKAELNWMQANPNKATKIYKSGTREFGGQANKEALQKVRQKVLNQYKDSKNTKFNKILLAGSSLGIFPLLSMDSKEYIPYKVSKNKNEQAIEDHKVNSNVQDKYWIYDKQNNVLKHKQKDKTLATFPVMGGLTGDIDGYNFYDEWFKDKSKNFYDGEKQAMSTPAGIFTLSQSNYEGKPAYRFNEGSRGNAHTNKKLAAMLHTMPSGRCDAFNKGSRNASFGCVNLPDEALNYIAKNYSANDSLYVLPINRENYIYESTDEGHPLKIKYNNAPQRAKLKHYNKTFDSYLKYNTGY